MQKIEVTNFGNTPEGNASLIQFSNGTVDMVLTNYGCTIISIETPDLFGEKKNVISGFNTIESYLEDDRYMGCVVGRFANRIANGHFSLDNTDYQLPVNNATNHLHGGVNGFNRKLAQIEKLIEEEDRIGVIFSFFSPDGDEGYPGNLAVRVSYILNTKNELLIQYEAKTDKPTILNLTNHSYFNLTGFKEATIHNHYLQIHAAKYIAKTPASVPSGEIKDVVGTALDFKQPTKLGDQINSLIEDRGYDHDFVLDNYENGVSAAANLLDPVSGRLLKVFTDNPGLHIYSANWWDGGLEGIHGKPYYKHAAVAVETQFFPDSPNHAHFPDVVIRPGQTFKSETIFQFQNIYTS